ncbi:MAG: GTP-binding protein TypA [Bdellovibrionales bacterium RIFOXYD12_FULL_39_22]|nr:MAG: GTP-binding protein TypA [Bdellovibrionales bacterium RIFOXYB1_FULL_39_21]OFZ44071.1 MAG: GTP-binding protein TypA [Bdellovibrionales bacterium RIFOXYC12_FULL_39_17]OFZ48527.1 MAG: GTP-binding protein TypA [Bdellovibrionales bacterium RIFOXYC1_FULL_39_130]OFZ76715.1 MAG: GTP-binding protein TypA [Bdellovibrionales bacterium RIFOXYD1_FULL_39_84]OFZ94993.1 MAG: GTP-binding protein TypA [Bdellovibrionales bacterium RIFOXYD12_FULL_39_22]HLE11198.1 GTP-binding protein [Bacteriovoracaceae ba
MNDLTTKTGDSTVVLPIKNVAIVAHVDHGKTTLVDGLLSQSGINFGKDAPAERVMDSGELEQERGITIRAKNCSIVWKGIKINLLDTPGHSDFGGEVERSLMMVDSVFLLVDASEGPLPQTRFVLQKAMERRLKIAVVINKVDRADQRVKEVEVEIDDLFLELASLLSLEDFDLHIPKLYASAREGWAVEYLEDPSQKGKNLHPLLDFLISDFFPSPKISPGPDLQLLVANLSYSPYMGPLMIGRIQRGFIRRLEQATWCGRDGKTKNFKVASIQVFGGLGQVEVDNCSAGEIAIISGFSEAEIGDTICSFDRPDPLPRVEIEPPTVSVNVSVSTSPLSGKEGEYLTSRKLEEFLEESCRLNVALRYARTVDPKVFMLKGRGEFQLAIVFEELRRKGFEFMVSRPEVIMKTDENGAKLEPFEMLILDVPSEFTGPITEKLSNRKGRMNNMVSIGENRTRIEFVIPSRGVIGYRSLFLTDTKGQGLMSSYFLGYKTYAGDMLARQNGALISDRAGHATPYALFNLLAVGRQFIKPGEAVYEGMVVGEHTRTNDSNINVVREKHLSSVRTAGKDENIILPPIAPRTLEWALDWIDDDEWVEVTPLNIRIRKKNLKQSDRSVVRALRES